MSYIEDLRLQQFRSYNDETFEFSPGVNIIVGPNASGKTNLLEALLCVCLGNSYRVPAAGLIAHDKNWARLEAHFGKTTVRVVKIDGRSGGTPKKIFEIDGEQFSRLGLARTYPVVLFEPEVLRLLSGSPERRRDFLDNLLEQTMPGYGRIRRDYQRSLLQRNTLLKQGEQRAKSSMFAWNIRLGELGEKIATERQKLITHIAADLQALYQRIATTKTRVHIAYDCQLPIEGYGSRLVRQLEEQQNRDFQRGFTSFGPHRDDMKVEVNEKPADTVASRGEMRTLVLVLKIIELRLVEETRGQKPLLLLDDVFSELDGARRQALTSYLSGYQTFITTTDADVVIQHFIDSCRIIPLG